MSEDRFIKHTFIIKEKNCVLIRIRISHELHICTGCYFKTCKTCRRQMEKEIHESYGCNGREIFKQITGEEGV